LFTEAKSDDDDNDLFSYLKLQDITFVSPVAVQLDKTCGHQHLLNGWRHIHMG